MAADLTETFMSKHVEKVVLAVAAVIFVGAVVWFVGMRQSQSDLREEVSRLVEDLRAKVREPRSIEDVMTPEERVALGIDLPGITVADLRQAVEGLPSDYDTTALVLGGRWWEPRSPIGPETEFAYAPPKEVLPVQQVKTAVGFGVTTENVPRPQATLKTASGDFYDVAWAGCVGKFDLTEQWEIYAEPYRQQSQATGKPFDPPVDPNSPITISRVELRRRELKADGTWTDWAVVPPTLSAAGAKVTPALPTNPRDKKDVVSRWYAGLTRNQAAIRREPFYPIAAPGEGQTVADVAGPVEGVAQPAIQPAGGKPAPTPPGAPAAPAAPPTPATPPPATTSPFETPFTPPPVPGTGPLVGPPAEREHLFATVWASDATVEPGKTYQYQMRVAIVNPVWSLPAVADEDLRWTLELPGQWSDPTDPVTIPELMQFYFVGTFGDRVNLELHRWIHGTWIVVPSVPRYLGGPVVYTKDRARIKIPGKNEEVAQDVTIDPGIFLVDVMRGFPYQPGGRNQPVNANVLLYADAKGDLQRRIDWVDQKKAANERLKRRQEGK